MIISCYKERRLNFRRIKSLKLFNEKAFSEETIIRMLKLIVDNDYTIWNSLDYEEQVIQDPSEEDLSSIQEKIEENSKDQRVILQLISKINI